MKQTVILLCFGLLFACTKKEGRTSYELFDVESSGGMKIEFLEVQLDSILFDPIESYHVGFVHVADNMLRFVDTYSGSVFVFDQDGRFIEQYLGRGRGPQEIPMTGIQFYSDLPDGRHLFIGSSFDYYLFDENYNRVKDGVIRWERDTPLEYLQLNPQPEKQRSYDLTYGLGVVRADETYAYLPLTAPSPQFSAFNFTTDLYAEQGRILAKMNLESGEIEKIIGRLSPVYAKNENKRMFSFFWFDFVRDQIAITYKADSLIHLFDPDFSKQQDVFGVAGREMDLNYKKLPSVNEENLLRRHWMEEFRERGFYTSLTYVEERDLLFRGYTRGGKAMFDGLQIYRGNNLIADLDVPRYRSEGEPNFFKISGYIHPWFYSNALIDESNREIKVYRFRIDE